MEAEPLFWLKVDGGLGFGGPSAVTTRVLTMGAISREREERGVICTLNLGRPHRGQIIIPHQSLQVQKSANSWQHLPEQRVQPVEDEGGGGKVLDLSSILRKFT